MKSDYSTTEEAKSQVKKLRGEKLKIKHNSGRNRYRTYTGQVVETYPNVFVIDCEGTKFKRMTCSYIDMVCGDLTLHRLDH